MGKGFRWLAKCFAFFGMAAGLLGIGTIAQVNGITSAVKNFFDPDSVYTVNVLGGEKSICVIIAGCIVTLLAALILIGGLKRISGTAQVLVPAMIVIYISCCLLIMITHITEIPGAVITVIESAFGIRPAAGGAAGIAVVMLSARSGIARGIFSNEAGLGSASIAAAAARTHSPVKQGLVTMTGTFIDTIIVCTMTGLSIVIAGSYEKPGLEGAAITADAFASGLPFPEQISSFLLMICLSVFAFTTILGWNYNAERCLSYLTGSNRTAALIFRWLYIAAVFIGPYLTVQAVWSLADILNGLMALPNIAALVCLSSAAEKETLSFDHSALE